jgi:hypothetical protein
MEPTHNLGVINVSLLIDVNLLFISVTHILREGRPSKSRIFTFGHIVVLNFFSQVILTWRSEIVYDGVIGVFIG